MTNKQRRAVAWLRENWIKIEKHESGGWIVIDTRYDTSENCFETLGDAIEHGKRQLGIYSEVV